MQLQRQGYGDAQRCVSALRRGKFATARETFAAITASPTAAGQEWLLYAQDCNVRGRDRLSFARGSLSEALKRVEAVERFARRQLVRIDRLERRDERVGPFVLFADRSK